jgi:hypothetical protein
MRYAPEICVVSTLSFPQNPAHLVIRALTCLAQACDARRTKCCTFNSHALLSRVDAPFDGI